MYFASVMFYFRLTNLALLVSLVVLGITQNQKAHRVHISNTLVIAMPGVSSIILARFSFTNTEDTDFFPSLMDRLRDFIELLQDSNSYPYLFCFVWFVVFLAVKFVRGYIFAFTFTLLYLILMLIMTGQMISHSKYLIEFIYSMTPLVGFMYKGNLTRSSYFSIIRNISVVLSLFAINYYGLISKSELVERTAIEATVRPNEAFSNSYLPQDPFPYKEAYEILGNKRESVCLSVGIVYGLVYEVWERFSVGELKVLRRQYDKLLMLQNEKNESPFSISADTILDSDITCFILGNVANKESTIKILRDSGWSVLSKLVDERFGSTVYVVVQDPVGANRINS